MSHRFMLLFDDLQYEFHQALLWKRFAILFVVFALLMGCSSGGGDTEDTDACSGRGVNNFMNPQVAELTMGLQFTFMDGSVFQDALAGETLTLTIDAFANPDITFLLATADHMASGESMLVVCSVSSEPACLFDVSITESNFPSGEGPQVNDVLVLQDLRFVGRLNNCTNRVTATLRVEDDMGMQVLSEPLDLGPRELCPMIGTCP